jgi:hypothetical protein
MKVYKPTLKKLREILVIGAFVLPIIVYATDPPIQGFDDPDAPIGNHIVELFLLAVLLGIQLLRRKALLKTG